MLDSGFFVGVDLGGTKIHTALAGTAGNVLAELRVPTEAVQGVDHVIERIAWTVRQVLKQAGVPAPIIRGIAVGSPGPLNARTGVIHFSPNLRWHNVPLKKLLAERLQTEVLVDSDANLAALGEHVYGAGRGVANMVYITVSTGVGSGLILDGRLYRGVSDGAGEIGHMNVLPEGPLCGCGARGCLEAVSSGTAIARAAKELVADGRGRHILRRAADNAAKISAVAVSAAAAEGDGEAAAIIAQAASFLGIGVSNIINLLNPEMIVLGGGVMEIGEPVWREVRREVAARSFMSSREHVQIVPAGLGQRAGVLGAVALCLSVFNDSQLVP